MKKLIASLCLISALYAAATVNPLAQNAAPATTNPFHMHVFEYATSHFDEENTAILWPDGTQERVADLNPRKKFDHGSEKYPRGADFRMYMLTTAMNLMAQRGYEIVSLNDRDLIMKRRRMGEPK